MKLMSKRHPHAGAIAAFLARSAVAMAVFATCLSLVAWANGDVISTEWYIRPEKLTFMDRTIRTAFAWAGAYDFSEKRVWSDPMVGEITVYEPLPPQLTKIHSACIDLGHVLPAGAVALFVYHCLARRYVQPRCATCGARLAGLQRATCPRCGGQL